MAFRFRFEKLLEHKRQLVDEQRQHIARLRRAHDKSVQEREHLERQRDSELQTIAELNTQGRLPEAQLYRDYLPTRQQQIQRKQVEINSLDVEIQKAEAQLRKLHRDQKTLEKLRERDQLAWEYEQKKAEAAFVEEIATQRHTRRNQQDRE